MQYNAPAKCRKLSPFTSSLNPPPHRVQKVLLVHLPNERRGQYYFLLLENNFQECLLMWLLSIYIFAIVSYSVICGSLVTIDITPSIHVLTSIQQRLMPHMGTISTRRMQWTMVVSKLSGVATWSMKVPVYIIHHAMTPTQPTTQTGPNDRDFMDILYKSYWRGVYM